MTRLGPLFWATELPRVSGAYPTGWVKRVAQDFRVTRIARLGAIGWDRRPLGKTIEAAWAERAAKRKAARRIA